MGRHERKVRSRYQLQIFGVCPGKVTLGGESSFLLSTRSSFSSTTRYIPAIYYMEANRHLERVTLLLTTLSLGSAIRYIPAICHAEAHRYMEAIRYKEANCIAPAQPLISTRISSRRSQQIRHISTTRSDLIFLVLNNLRRVKLIF